MLKLRQEQPKNEEESLKAHNFYRYHNQLYKEVAEQSGETDYENYWERNYEHNLQPNTLPLPSPCNLKKCEKW